MTGWRYAPCGCVWLIGSDDHGCQEDECRCVEHHPQDDT